MAHDYELVEAAIVYWNDHPGKRPDLAELAAAIGLNEHDFEALCQRWAGVSAKRLLQFLTVDYTRQRLAEAPSLLQASPHGDVFATLEAEARGGIPTGGQGLTIYYGWHDSPFGCCLLAATERAIHGLSFTEEGDIFAIGSVWQTWPRATFVRDEAVTEPLARRVFAIAPTTGEEPLHLLVSGTDFQVQVWRALLRVPPGHVVAYSDVAAMIGRPQAGQAVGRAVARNPIAYVIPCHRVILRSGAVGNYDDNPWRKQAMLVWEAAHVFGQGEDT